MIFLAICLPCVYFFITGNIIRSTVSFCMMCTGIGWIFASLWAISYRSDRKAERWKKDLNDSKRNEGVILLVVLFLNGCASDQEILANWQNKIDTEWLNLKNENDKVIKDYWNLIDWSYLSKDNYIVTSVGKIDPSSTTRDLPAYVEVTKNPPVSYLEEMGIKKAVLGNKFEEIQKRTSENYNGLDPFESEKMKKPDSELLKSKVFEIRSNYLDIRDYNLEKQTYTIKYLDEFSVKKRISFEDYYRKGTIRYFCPEVINIPLPRDIAEKVKSYKDSFIYLHTVILPELKTHSYKRKVCLRSNEFADDGCLQWGIEDFAFKIRPLQIISIDLISLSESLSVSVPYHYQGYDRWYKLSPLNAVNMYHYNFKKPLSLECSAK